MFTFLHSHNPAKATPSDSKKLVCVYRGGKVETRIEYQHGYLFLGIRFPDAACCTDASEPAKMRGEPAENKRNRACGQDRCAHRAAAERLHQ